MRSEVNTEQIISELTAAGKRVRVPRVANGVMSDVKNEGELELVFGIPQPVAGADEPCGVVLPPLLAFDEEGYRVGYGGGYYDKYLKNAKTKKVGLGYSFQIEDFKEDEWDVPLDLFICEKGIYDYAIHG